MLSVITSELFGEENQGHGPGGGEGAGKRFAWTAIVPWLYAEVVLWDTIPCRATAPRRFITFIHGAAGNFSQAKPGCFGSLDHVPVEMKSVKYENLELSGLAFQVAYIARIFHASSSIQRSVSFDCQMESNGMMLIVLDDFSSRLVEAWKSETHVSSVDHKSDPSGVERLEH